MGLLGSRKFFEVNIFSFPRFKRLASRERSSALMAHGRLICLTALSGQPQGRAGLRGGLTAEARAELIWGFSGQESFSRSTFFLFRVSRGSRRVSAVLH